MIYLEYYQFLLAIPFNISPPSTIYFSLVIIVLSSHEACFPHKECKLSSGVHCCYGRVSIDIDKYYLILAGKFITERRVSEVSKLDQVC